MMWTLWIIFTIDVLCVWCVNDVLFYNFFTSVKRQNFHIHVDYSDYLKNMEEPKNEITKKITGIIKASHVVTHRNTGLTRCCLTSLSGTGSGMVSII